MKNSLQDKRMQLIEDICCVIEHRDIGQCKIKMEFTDGATFDFRTGLPCPKEPQSPKGLIATVIDWIFG